MLLNPRRLRGTRGSILLLSIFFLIVLFFLAMAFFRIIPAEFHSATQTQRMVQSQYAADAGVREVYSFLQNTPTVTQTSISDFNSKHSDPAAALVKIDKDWSYTVSIEMIDAVRGIYEVQSVAYVRGRAVRELRTTIANDSFSKYALFYDTWGDDFLFTMGSNSIQGPFHTNSYFHLAAPNSAFWTDGKVPFVTGSKAEMTFANDLPLAQNTLGTGDGNMYYGGNFAGSDLGLVPFDADGTPSTDRYNRMIEGGREKISRVQKVDFPEAVTELSVKAWGGVPPNSNTLNTLERSHGSLLVNTDQGANVAGGKVAGGVHIQSDANSVHLEITTGNGDHQKIRVNDADWVEVAGPPTTVYKIDQPQYRQWYTPPPRTVRTQGACLTTNTVYDPVYEYRNEPVSVTEAHPSCGTEIVFIPATGSVSTPITVNKVCTRPVDNWVRYQTGTTPRTVCTSRAPDVVTTVQDPSYWKYGVGANEAGAEQYGTNPVDVPANTPGSYPVTNTNNKSWIPSWNSVVEVNDAPYKIPFFEGVKVNGRTITNANDPALTVLDGNTVAIKNDTVQNGINYAEYTVLEGRTNGVVYSNGNLGDVRGVNKGAKSADAEGNINYVGRTIATDIENNKTLEISGNILQYYGGENSALKDNGNNVLKRGEQSPNSDHILGLVAKDISINQRDPNNYWWLRNSSDYANTRDAEGKITNYSKGITVYGVLMAGRKIDSTRVEGGFGAHEEAMRNGDGIGDFNLFGGIISGNARKTQTPYAGQGTHGFRLNLNYDEIAAMNLQNFPRPKNVFTIVRYVNFALGNLDDGFGSMSGGR